MTRTRSRAKLKLASQDGEAVAPPARIPAVLEFQPDAIELEERDPPRLARLTLYGILAMMGLGLTWSVVAKLDETVVAKGKLVTASPGLVVQPLETAVIREMIARPGDRVVAGQVLARLDPTFIAADSGQLAARLRAQDAEIARLEAELAERDYVPDTSQEAQLQAQLFAQRRAFHDAKLRDYDSQVAEAQATLAASDSEEEMLTRRLQGLHEIDEMRLRLIDGGTGSRLTYLQSRDLSLETEASLQRLRNDRVEARQRVAQAEAGAAAFREDLRQTATERLVTVREERSETVEQMKKAAMREQLSTLRAPADGVVLEVAARSVGSVVQEAETLVTLVPLGVPLVAEVAVEGRDIGRMAVADAARIKFDAFPFQKYGTADGTVRVISQDAFSPDQEGVRPAIYRVRVSVDDLALRNLPPGFQPLPGMSLQAEIRTGERRVISYFLYPLLRGFDESFREP